jgi:hypothetical protein
MESFNKVGPWITLGIVCGIVLFFSVFFIVKLITSRKTVSIGNLDNDQKTTTLSARAKEKLKKELVADIERTLERAL